MKRIIFNFCFVWLAVSAFAGSKVVEMRNYGLVPDTHENLSPKLQKALQDIKSQVALGDKVTLLFESGRYDFHPEGAAVREYYISNHDQDNPKTVGFPLEDWKGLTVDGQGADFIVGPPDLVGACHLQVFRLQVHIVAAAFGQVGGVDQVGGPEHALKHAPGGFELF